MHQVHPMHDQIIGQGPDTPTVDKFAFQFSHNISIPKTLPQKYPIRACHALHAPPPLTHQNGRLVDSRLAPVNSFTT